MFNWQQCENHKSRSVVLGPSNQSKRDIVSRTASNEVTGLTEVNAVSLTLTLAKVFVRCERSTKPLQLKPDIVSKTPSNDVTGLTEVNAVTLILTLAKALFGYERSKKPHQGP